MKILAAVLLATATIGALAQAPITSTTTPVARMANAYPICGEGCTITAMPVGTVWQFGKDETKYGQVNTWLPPQTSTATTPTLPFFVYYTDWPVNPTPETKEIDVQQTSVPQTIVYTNPCSPSPCTPTAVTVVVPALAASTPPASTAGVNFNIPPLAAPMNCWEGTVNGHDTGGTAQVYKVEVCQLPHPLPTGSVPTNVSPQ